MHWLAPNHYDPKSNKLLLSVHSWLLQLDGRKILIDGCCGNQKSRPQRPAWHMLNTPWLDRLAAAGARPDEIDLVMCTHLHHDHVGWNTQLKDGKWVPTFPNARYVFSKLDFDYFHKLDNDPATAPTEFGSFRECVVPVVEAGRADLVTGPHVLDEFIEILPAGGHSPGHFYFRLNVGGDRAMITGDVFHHLLQVLVSGLELPEEFRPPGSAREPPPHVRRSGSVRRAGFSGTRRRTVCRPHRKDRRVLQTAILGCNPRGYGRDSIRRRFADDNIVHR